MVHDMNDYTSRSVNVSGCPIDILPNEILSEIQLIAIDAQISDKQRYKFPSTLCWISRHWRRVALDTPRIWSFIFISSTHAVGYLEARLEKTGVVPLDIKIDDPQKLLDHNKVMKTLLNVHGRWRSFSLQTAQIEEFAPHLPESLPFLESITFTGTFRPFKIMTLFPKLKYMTISSSPRFWDSSVTFAHLVEFRVRNSSWLSVAVEKMLHHLRNCPNLEVLVLSSAWTFRTVSVEDSQALSLQKVILPKLRAMALEEMYAWEFAMLLSWIRAPNLHRLTATVVTPGAGTHLPDSPSIQQVHLNFPSLQKLALVDMDLSGDEIRHILLQLPNVPILALVRTLERPVDFILDIILKESALAGIKEVHICGVPMTNLHRCLSNAPVPSGPESLLSESKWKIYRDVASQNPITAEETLLLTELRSFVPKLEVKYDRLQWEWE